MNFTKDQVGDSSALSYLGATPSPASVLPYLTAAAVIFVTVFGNLLVIISICHFKQLHTPTNFILLSLAVADFLVGVSVMPFHFALLLDPDWCFDVSFCTIFKVASFHLTCVSICNVAFISVDRYLALSNPLLYCTKMTVNRTIRILNLLWMCSLIYNLSLLYDNGNFSVNTGNATCAECIVTVNEIWTIFDFIVIFIMPLLTIVFMYLKIFTIAKRHAKKIKCARKHNFNSTNLNNFSMASETKAAKTLGILVLVFLLCLVPFYLSSFSMMYIREPSMYLVNTANSLIYLNSTINPIIYALLYPWFQRSVKLILTLRICTSQSSFINVLVKQT